MKMLLHLMGKDLRHVRGQLIFFAVCLLAALSVPLVQRWVDEPHWSFPLLYFASLILIASMMMGLLVAWIHLDHPRDSTGFMQTRPLSPVMLWLPKSLCWVLFLLLPVLAAMLLQLMFYQLDLSSADYMKFISRAFLRICGAYGVMALIAVLIRHHRIAAFVCLIPLIFTIVLQSSRSSSSATFEQGDLVSGFNLEISRGLVAQSLTLAGGFMIAGMILARRRWPVWLLAIFGISGVRLLTEHYWPWDLTGCRQPVAVLDQPRVGELENKVRMSPEGRITLTDHAKGEAYGYKTDPLRIDMPAGAIEWPYVNTVISSRLSLADGALMESIQSVVMGESRGWQSFYPSTPPQVLLNLVGHHEAGGAGTFLLTHHWSQLRVVTQKPLPKGGTVGLAGSLDVSWFRPVILADLPLEAGVFFAHEGRSMKVLEASSGGGQLHLKLCLTSFHPRETPISLADVNPAFQIFAAHPGRREITTRSRESQSITMSSSLAVDELVFTAEYDIMDEDDRKVRVDPFWAQKARLYVVRRENIGRGIHRYEGKVTAQP